MLRRDGAGRASAEVGDGAGSKESEDLFAEQYGPLEFVPRRQLRLRDRPSKHLPHPFAPFAQGGQPDLRFHRGDQGREDSTAHGSESKVESRKLKGHGSQALSANLLFRLWSFDFRLRRPAHSRSGSSTVIPSCATSTGPEYSSLACSSSLDGSGS